MDVYFDYSGDPLGRHAWGLWHAGKKATGGALRPRHKVHGEELALQAALRWLRGLNITAATLHTDHAPLLAHTAASLLPAGFTLIYTCRNHAGARQAHRAANQARQRLKTAR